MNISSEIKIFILFNSAFLIHVAVDIATNLHKMSLKDVGNFVIDGRPNPRMSQLNSNVCVIKQFTIINHFEKWEYLFKCEKKRKAI